MKKRNLLIIISTFILIIGCKDNDKLDYSKLGSKSANDHFQAVIEIPAGTNKKFEYNYSNNEFECELINGKKRSVNYIPYVGNYGFIPSTLMDTLENGDGDAVDILVLSSSIDQGAIIEIDILGALELYDSEELDHKIIAIPVNNELKTYRADSLNTSVKTIIETWFTSYKQSTSLSAGKWYSKTEAIDLIRTASK
jgi:inorganic pyrophosphatase